jgi:hypothetical protein
MVRVMPDLPNIAVYIECLERRITGQTLSRLLKRDWPRTLDELESRAARPAG